MVTHPCQPAAGMRDCYSVYMFAANCGATVVWEDLS